MTFHVTYRDRSGAIHTTRASGTGATPSAARRDAIRTAAARHGIGVGGVMSAVAIRAPRAVTPYPEALTPGG